MRIHLIKKKIVNKLIYFSRLFLSDKSYLRLKFSYCLGYKLNLDAPKSYNEKIQWLKLHHVHPEYSKFVDKIEAKKVVGDLLGPEYVIPNIAVFDRIDDVDFDKLPNQFVMKCTHDSGGVVVCKDKSSFNPTKALKKLRRSLRTNFYNYSLEYCYKNIKPRILVEQYMEDESGELRDYKFFCFHGKVKMVLIATERQTESETKFDFFDENFQHLPFMRNHPNSSKTIEKPMGFEKMKELAERLSEQFVHVRIDFYNIKGCIYFGEFTLFPGSGFSGFTPREWDYKIGSWLHLPNSKN